MLDDLIEVCAGWDDEDWLRVDKDTHADGARKRVESIWINANATRQPSLFREDNKRQ